MASGDGRYLLVAVDSSTVSPDAQHSATLSLAAALAAPGDEIHLLSVLPARGGGAAASHASAGPLSTAAAAEAAVAARREASASDRRSGSSWLLSCRSALVGSFGIDPERVFLHLLNPTAAATTADAAAPTTPTPSSSTSSSTAAAIVAYAHAKRADAVVIGSRGMGTAARALGSIVGLGSVSEAVVAGLHGAACAVARRKGERPLSLRDAPAIVKVAVAVDGSPASDAALAFACRWCSGGGSLSGRATLLIVSAAQVPPFPYVYEGDFSPGSSGVVAATVGAERWEEDKAAAAAASRAAVERAASLAVEEHGIDSSMIEKVALTGGEGEGGGMQPGASDALLEAIEARRAGAVVCGSRGLGAWRAAALALVGMGSVSRALLHRSKVPVVVVKSAEEEEVVDEDGSA